MQVPINIMPHLLMKILVFRDAVLVKTCKTVVLQGMPENRTGSPKVVVRGCSQTAFTGRGR